MSHDDTFHIQHRGRILFEWRMIATTLDLVTSTQMVDTGILAVSIDKNRAVGAWHGLGAWI